MSVTPAQLAKLSSLSRLKFTEEKLQSFSKEFNNIISFVEKIQEVDTTGVAPITAMGEAASTPERTDAVTEKNHRDVHQKNAPKAEMGFYIVPQIVE